MCLALSLSDVVFIALVNVKMPTIVGILTFMSRINFVLSWVEHGSFITSGPEISRQHLSSLCLVDILLVLSCYGSTDIPTSSYDNIFKLQGRKPIEDWYGYDSGSYTQICQLVNHRIVIIFLLISLSMWFGWKKEPSHWDGSFEYPQNMFWLRNENINFLLHTLIWRPVENVIL